MRPHYLQYPVRYIFFVVIAGILVIVIYINKIDIDNVIVGVVIYM